MRKALGMSRAWNISGSSSYKDTSRRASENSRSEVERIVDGSYHRRMSIGSTCEPCPSSSPATVLDAAAALFRSLSDVARLVIVRRLAQGEARVVDLVDELGLAQSTVSAHVACLRDCQLVSGRPEGRQVFYSLVRPELLEVLAAAEVLLAATGSAVALRPSYGTECGSSAGDP